MNHIIYMESETIQILKPEETTKQSRFVASATARLENESWLRWSRQVAISLIDYMGTNSINRTELAERLGVSPQYISRLLSGHENLSLKSLANINERLGINVLQTE